MFHPQIKVAIHQLQSSNVEGAVKALEIAVSEGSHDAVRLLAYLLERHSESTVGQLDRWIEQSFQRLGNGEGFAAYVLGCIASQQCQTSEVVLDFYTQGFELGDLHCGVNVAVVHIMSGDLNSAGACVSKLGENTLYGLWLKTSLDLVKSGIEEPDRQVIGRLLAAAEPNDVAFVIQSLGAFELLGDEKVRRTLKEVSDRGCHRSTYLLAAYQVQSLMETQNVDESNALRDPAVQDMLVLGTLQGSPMCATQVAGLAMVKFGEDQTEENFAALLDAALDAAYLGNPGWMLFVLEQAIASDSLSYAEFWFTRILNCDAEEVIAQASERMERAGSDASESDDTPEYFLVPQSNFTTGLEERDISRTLLIDDSPGSFPMLPILEMDGFLDSVIRRDEQAFETIQMWQREERWNYLSALGYLLRIRSDHALGIELLEASGDMGNVHAWFNLGCEPEGLDPVQRESYLRKAVDMKHGGAAYVLALMSVEENDFSAANEWLIRAAKLGDVTSTRALSQMVTSDDERRMLAQIADAQELAQNPDKGLPAFYADDVARLLPSPSACTWENLVALRTANVGQRWWGAYGPSSAVELEGVNWQVSAAFRSPESESDSHAAPIRGGFQQADVEFVASPLLQRVVQVCERLGVTMHAMTTPANVDGLLGTWTTPLGIECLQFATAYQDPQDPSSEAILWQVHLLAYPEHPDILTDINSRTYVGALLETALYMAETQKPTLNDWLNETTRDIKFGNISNDLAPCPYLRVRQAETVSGFQDGEWTGCHSGMVFSAGYFLSSKLTDEQLEAVIPEVSNALLLTLDIFSGATEPPTGVPSLHDFVKVLSLRDLGKRNGTLDESEYVSTSNPRLSVASTLSRDDEVWPSTNGTNSYALSPGDSQNLAALLEQEMLTNPSWIDSSAYKTALQAGLLEALDLASIEAERQGDQEGTSKFYLEGARRGYPQAINNLALEVDRHFEDNPGFLQIGLFLSAALCGDTRARQNLRRAIDEAWLPHSESDLLRDAELLNSLGWVIKQNLPMVAALPVFEAACRAGSSNALATYSWWALTSGETSHGLQMFDSCITRVHEGSVTEEAKHQVTNALSNYALLLFAVGRDIEALDIARSAEQARNPEALAMPAVIARMRGDLEQSREIAQFLTSEMKTELQRIANDVLEVSGDSWFAQYARTLLEVINDSGQSSKPDSVLADKPAFALKNWVRPVIQEPISAPNSKGASKALEDVLTSEGLVLKFAGVYNSEGAEASISNRIFFECSHESHLTELCVECGRDATCIATIQSGFGDGTYAVLEIIAGPSNPSQEQTAVGVFVVLDSGVTQSLVDQVDERTLEIPVAQLSQITDLPLWTVGTLEKVSDLYISDSGSNSSSHSAIVDVSALPGDYQVGMYVQPGDTGQGLATFIPRGMLALSGQLMQDRGIEFDSPSLDLEEIRAGWRGGNVFANMASGLENAALLNRSISVSDTEYWSWTYQLMNGTTNESLKEQLALEIKTAFETGGTELLQDYLEAEYLDNRGDFGRVEKLLNKVIQDKVSVEEFGLTEVWAAAINTLAFSILIPRRELTKARTLLVQAIQQDVGYQSTNAKSNLAILALAENQLDEARDLAIQVMVEEESLAAESRDVLAKVAILENDPDTAVMYFQENFAGTAIRHRKSAYMQLRALGVAVPSWKSVEW